jgi:hypothetical protein
MICAVDAVVTAHQRRKGCAPLLIGALREKGNGARRAITLSLTAHQWRSSAAFVFAGGEEKRNRSNAVMIA